MWTICSSGEIVCFGGEEKDYKEKRKEEQCVHFVFNRVTKFNARLVHLAWLILPTYFTI